MKYCVSARQPAMVLKKADEIYVKWNDHDYAKDLCLDYPDKNIIIELPNSDSEEIDISEIRSYGNNITLAISDFNKYTLYKSFHFSFYWKYPVTSYFELRALKEVGVSQILVGAPLYFDLQEVAKFEIPIRLVANLAYDNFIPRENGVKGTYVRPEDVPLYEQYVSTIEFFSEGLSQEEALLRIYQEDQKWNGNLNKIIANLKYNVDNRGLPKEFGTARIQCRHKCMRNGTCNFCETAFIFSRKLDEAKEHWVKTQED